MSEGGNSKVQCYFKNWNTVGWRESGAFKSSFVGVFSSEDTGSVFWESGISQGRRTKVEKWEPRNEDGKRGASQGHTWRRGEITLGNLSCAACQLLEAVFSRLANQGFRVDNGVSRKTRSCSSQSIINMKFVLILTSMWPHTLTTVY